MMRQSQKYGIIGSAIFMLLLFLLLWFVHIGKFELPEDEGIMVSFGNAADGGGYQEPVPATPAVATTPPAPATPTPPQQQDLMTQEDEEALALAKQKKIEEQKQREEQLRQEQERKEKERQEQERLEQERIAKEKAEAERRAKEQQAIENANKLGSLFGNTQGQTGSGEGSGNTQKGNPVGKGNSGGNSWSLNGRSLNGALATPNYTSNDEGRVVVSIRVNEAGRVISASVASGTTISDKSVQAEALKAARQAVFSSGKGEVVGTITYNFRNK